MFGKCCALRRKPEVWTIHTTEAYCIAPVSTLPAMLLLTKKEAEITLQGFAGDALTGKLGKRGWRNAAFPPVKLKCAFEAAGSHYLLAWMVLSPSSMSVHPTFTPQWVERQPFAICLYFSNPLPLDTTAWRDNWEHVTEAANSISFLFSKHPCCSLP